MNVTDELARLCADVKRAPQQVSLRELLEVFVPDTNLGLLARMSRLQDGLNLLSFVLDPGLDNGDLDCKRLLALHFRPAPTGRLEAEIAGGERQTVEFKSSFCCCIRTYNAKPGLAREHYRKVEVEFASLTAMAGLMNTGGGVVLVGVSDDGDVLGLEPDYFALGIGGPDKWLLYLRSKIEAGFVDGRSVSNLLDIEMVEHSGQSIARVAVQARQKLTFLKNWENVKCPPKLFRRLGNQTVEVKMENLEDFFEQRARLRGGTQSSPA